MSTRSRLDNLVRLKDEIYRVCYLMNQAGGSMSKNSQMTGLSKQRDFRVTQEVLRAYGDAVKDHLKQVLRATGGSAAGQADDRRFGAGRVRHRGLQRANWTTRRELLGLGIPSETLERQVHKKLAFKYLCDASQEVKDRIAEEIDGSEA